ncbi:MAG: caspase family protein [Rhodospirillales bacterium]|nr:caspase family protein [Rhodospirillales bacterium]
MLAIGLAIGCIGAVLVSTSAAGDEQLATHPVLRIETGMHTAPILRVAVSRDSRFMATASLDKTVRVWSVADGKLIRTLRMPVGIGYEGALHALAISPDGSRLVAGGWTGNWDGGWSLYEFELATGRLAKHVAGVPERPVHMTYSEDGRHLAVVMKNNMGLRVYRADDFNVVAEDRDYTSDSVSAEFAPDGRLLTTGLDGYLRLYDKDFKRSIKEAAPGGKWAVEAKFSPDGKKIAVGYADSTRVDILSGDTLKLLAQAHTGDIKEGYLARVAWSADGRYLYAGGRYDRGGWNPIRRWSTDSYRRYSEFPAVTNAVMQIIPLKDGQIIYAGRDPIIGVINEGFRKKFAHGPSTSDFRGNFEGFRVSEDATTIEFSFEPWGKRPGRFSLLQRKLAVEPKDDATNLSPFLAEAEGLIVSDWRTSYALLLNDKLLRLQPHENSNAYAFAPDGKAIYIGTSFRLVEFDRDGREGWQFRAPAEVYGVNVAPNGKLVVAALADGTIRWYRRHDGQELLAFFPHRDGQRWIAWTPSGYYMASPGGDTLIGWHLNRGTSGAPDFFPAAQLRDNFYRPDVVIRILFTLDEAEALKKADAERGGKDSQSRDVTSVLPPVITITGPSQNAAFDEPRVKVTYELRAPSGMPVRAVKVLVNGRPAQRFDRQPIVVGADVHKGQFELIVPRRDVEVSLIAENVHAASLPSSVKLKWVGPKSEQLRFRNKLYVLAIGVSDYRDSKLKLGYAAEDARDFARIIGLQKGLAYSDVIVKSLTDKEATLENIRRGLDWIEKSAKGVDVAMVFVAGHGVDDAEGSYYFLPHDADAARLESTGVNYADFRKTLASIPALTYLFIDTCHSGDALGRPGRPSTDTTRLINDLSSAENGIVVFASSTGEQVSYENPAWENGAFTAALVEGLDGKAALVGRDYITVGMLNVYVSERVQDLTGGAQTPTSAIPTLIPDLHIALKRGTSIR